MKKLLFVMTSIVSLQSFGSEKVLSESENEAELKITTPGVEYFYTTPKIWLSNQEEFTIANISVKAPNSNLISNMYRSSLQENFKFATPIKNMNNETTNKQAAINYDIDENWSELMRELLPINNKGIKSIKFFSNEELIINEIHQFRLYSKKPAFCLFDLNWKLDRLQTKTLMINNELNVSLHFTYNGVNTEYDVFNKFIYIHRLILDPTKLNELDTNKIMTGHYKDIAFKKEETLTDKLIHLIAKNNKLYNESQNPEKLPKELIERIEISRKLYNQ